MEHLQLLAEGKEADLGFWKDVHYLAIRNESLTEERSFRRENRWYFEFSNFPDDEPMLFSTKQFALNQNSKFREHFFQNTGVVTPAVKGRHGRTGGQIQPRLRNPRDGSIVGSGRADRP
jgi:hypothetical protein